MYFTYLYTTTSEIIYEGDNLSVFGIVNYNVKSDEFTIDDPLGFIQDGQTDILVDKLTEKAWGIVG